MSDFYITLPSSVPNPQFKNTSSRFVTRLPEVLNLERDKYVVAATDIIYPYSYVNVGKPLDYWIHFKSGKLPIHITFPPAQYSDAAQIVNTLNDTKTTRLKRSAVNSFVDDEMSRIKRAKREDVIAEYDAIVAAENVKSSVGAIAAENRVLENNEGQKNFEQIQQVEHFLHQDQQQQKAKDGEEIQEIETFIHGEEQKEKKKKQNADLEEIQEIDEFFERKEEPIKPQAQQTPQPQAQQPAPRQPAPPQPQAQQPQAQQPQKPAPPQTQAQQPQKPQAQPQVQQPQQPAPPQPQAQQPQQPAPPQPQAQPQAQQPQKPQAQPQAQQPQAQPQAQQPAPPQPQAQQPQVQQPEKKKADLEEIREIDEFVERKEEPKKPEVQQTPQPQAQLPEKKKADLEEIREIDEFFERKEEPKNEQPAAQPALVQQPAIQQTQQPAQQPPPVRQPVVELPKEPGILVDPNTGEKTIDEFHILDEAEKDDVAQIEKEYTQLEKADVIYNDVQANYATLASSIISKPFDDTIYQATLQNFKKVRAKLGAATRNNSKEFLMFKDVGDQIHIQFLNDDISFVEFDEPCAYFLGFVDPIVRETTRAPKKIDYFGNVSTIYLYCDVVDPIIVGNTKSSLLSVIPCRGGYGEMIHYTVAHPRYLPLMKSTIDSIRVDLLTEFSEPIDFNWGSTIIVLHFKRIE